MKPHLGHRTLFNNEIKTSFFFKDFYLFMRERERQRHRQREKQAPHRELTVGLDPGSPGSRQLSHPGCPVDLILI